MVLAVTLSGCFDFGHYDFHFCPVFPQQGESCLASDSDCTDGPCRCVADVDGKLAWQCDFTPADLAVKAEPRDLSLPSDGATPRDLSLPSDGAVQSDGGL